MNSIREADSGHGRRFLPDIDQGILTLFRLNLVTLRDTTELMMDIHPRVPLRTLDAIHLATYRAVNAGLLFAKDKWMLAAAKLLGFETAG